MIKKLIVVAVGLALLAALFVGHVNTQAQTTDKTIVEIAQEDGNFTSLVAALTAAGLVETLNGTGPFTVFAPTDAAFAKLDPAVLNDLLTMPLFLLSGREPTSRQWTFPNRIHRNMSWQGHRVRLEI